MYWDLVPSLAPSQSGFIKVRFFFFALRHSPCSLFSPSWWGSALLTKAKRLEKKEEKHEEKKALCYLHCQNKQVRAQTQRGPIHREQWQAPVLSKPKEKSIVCECDPSVPPPLHLSTLLSHHFYRTLNAFVRSRLFSVFHRPPSPWQWPTFLHALTIKIQLSSSVILWEHSELSSSDQRGVMSVPRHMGRSANGQIGEKLLLTAEYLVFIVHAD